MDKVELLLKIVPTVNSIKYGRAVLFLSITIFPLLEGMGGGGEGGRSGGGGGEKWGVTTVSFQEDSQGDDLSDFQKMFT